MTRPRVKALIGYGSPCFHVLVRLDRKAAILDDIDKEALVSIMQRLARFSGVELLNYCVMGNHFHMLVKVPPRDQWVKRFKGKVGEARLMEHLLTLYPTHEVETLKRRFAGWRNKGRAYLVENYLAAFKERFCDISVYNKEVKTRFTKWRNRRLRQRGTVWQEKFRSVVVESPVQASPKRSTSEGNALRVLSAYIDLNPVRAGLVDTAEEYRWSGWAAAVAGNKEARVALCDILQCEVTQWRQARVQYAKTLKEWQIDSSSFLMNHVRAFAEGVAVGSEGFVEEVFQQRRELFSTRRKRGAMKLLDWQADATASLYTLRNFSPLPHLQERVPKPKAKPFKPK